MMNNQFILNYRELHAYQAAIDMAMQVFDHSREFPPEEHELLTVPMIRASRLVCTSIAQAWLRRRYQSAFIANLNRAETETATTQVWLEVAVLCGYLDTELGQELHHEYQKLLADLARLIEHSSAWILPITLTH